MWLWNKLSTVTWGLYLPPQHPKSWFPFQGGAVSYLWPSVRPHLPTGSYLADFFHSSFCSMQVTGRWIGGTCFPGMDFSSQAMGAQALPYKWALSIHASDRIQALDSGGSRRHMPCAPVLLPFLCLRCHQILARRVLLKFQLHSYPLRKSLAGAERRRWSASLSTFTFHYVPFKLIWLVWRVLCGHIA